MVWSEKPVENSGKVWGQRGGPIEDNAQEAARSGSTHDKATDAPDVPDVADEAIAGQCPHPLGPRKGHQHHHAHESADHSP